MMSSKTSTSFSVFPLHVFCLLFIYLSFIFKQKNTVTNSQYSGIRIQVSDMLPEVDPVRVFFVMVNDIKIGMIFLIINGIAQL